MKGLIVSSFLLLGCIQASGQERQKEVCVGFPVGKSTLDTAYGDNATKLSEVVSFLERVKRDSTLELVEVSFSGFASPEGSFALNRKLAERRCNSLEYYVRERILLPDSIISRSEGFIAWKYLAELVENSDMPHREEAVDVLLNGPEFTYDRNGLMIDSRKKRLQELQYGRTWHYMYEHFFWKVRNAVLVLVTIHHKPVINEKPVTKEEKPIAPVSVDTTVVAKILDPVVAEPPAVLKPFHMALKTNMLYDALAVLNIGAEFHLGRNWSVGINWMYGWWKKESRQRYWRIYGGDVALRKWFGKRAGEKPLTGHHVGVYGQAFTFDFEWGGKGYMGGKPGGTLWERANYAVGVEYGYSLPVARCMNIDFALGVGYWGGKYYEYNPLDGHYVWQASKNRHWFGPTKAEISLVWLLGRGNYNQKKGGRQ
ncbi:DUF3575 domain-containing protein [Alistipes sp.]|uniref:DUF3575 domain-containing protein n=1 Tax=Alistipes sp. TaxID=1872444 RepID=UPI0025C0D0FC|nr:DUF3575 domain-containing protein [Alistipes sp.]